MEAKAALYEKMARGEIEGETLYVTACEQDMLKYFVIFLFHLFYPYFIFFYLLLLKMKVMMKKVGDFWWTSTRKFIQRYGRKSMSYFFFIAEALQPTFLPQ